MKRRSVSTEAGLYRRSNRLLHLWGAKKFLAAARRDNYGLTMQLDRDAIRLLYTLQSYSIPNGASTPQCWLKLDLLHAIAHLGITSGVFETYDLAPALLPFRGIKMYAMISQEVVEEVGHFFDENLVEKLLLNSWFYATVTAIRITSTGLRLLDETLTDEDRDAVDNLVRCPKCNSVLDFAVATERKPEVRLVMNRVCSCLTRGRHRRDDDWLAKCPPGVCPIEGFFSIGEVQYKSKPFFFGNTP